MHSVVCTRIIIIIIESCVSMIKYTATEMLAWYNSEICHLAVCYLL